MPGRCGGAERSEERDEERGRWSDGAVTHGGGADGRLGGALVCLSLCAAALAAR
jgi:hypothetical protein